MSQPASPIPNRRRIHRIQLEVYDDVISIKDRLQFVKAGRVLLVFPQKHKILQRKLDLVLIQREAIRRGLRLALVTQDVAIFEHAEDLNISAFYTVEDARTSRWKRPKNKVFTDRTSRPEEQPQYYELMGRATRLRPGLSPVQYRIWSSLRGVIFGIMILAVMASLYGIIPSATVTITPASDQLNVTIPLVADANALTLDQLTVPADIRRFPESATVAIDTSGRRNAENSLAEGVVTFENLTAVAVFVPAGTIVETDSFDPVQFETLSDVAVAARQGATGDVNIRALENSSGVQGNLGANQIVQVDGTLASSVSVQNYNPTYGGGVRETSFATESDRERLITLAQQQLKQNARTQILLSLDESLSYLVDDSITIVEERNLSYSAEVNAPADTISLTMQGVVEATVIDLTEARLAAFTNLGDYVTPGRVLDEATLSFRLEDDDVQILADGRVAFLMRVEGSTLVDIDPEDVRQRLTGLSTNEAYETLEREYLLDPRYPPEISVFPGLISRMPILPARIQVEVQ